MLVVCRLSISHYFVYCLVNEKGSNVSLTSCIIHKTTLCYRRSAKNRVQSADWEVKGRLCSELIGIGSFRIEFGIFCIEQILLD